MEDCVLGSVCQVISPGIVAGNDQIPHSLLPQSCYQVLWNTTQSKPCTQHTTISSTSVLLEGSVLSYLRLGVSNHHPHPQLCSPHSRRTWHHVMRRRRTLAAQQYNITTIYDYTEGGVAENTRGEGLGRFHCMYLTLLWLARREREGNLRQPLDRGLSDHAIVAELLNRNTARNECTLTLYYMWAWLA